MRGRNRKGWWDSQATPRFLPTSLLGTGWEVTGGIDPNPNYRMLFNQAHSTYQLPGLNQSVGRSVTSGPRPHRLLLLSICSCAVW